MSTKPAANVVGLCSGKDCRRSHEFSAMKHALSRCEVVETRCLDICDGPVVILAPLSAEPVVLSKLRSPKDVRDVGRLVRNEIEKGGISLSARLEKRRVLGSKRRSALRRAARSFRR